MARRRSDAVDEAAKATAAVEAMVTSPNAGVPPARGSTAGKPELPKPKMAAGYERVIERVFDLPDPDSMFAELIDAIEIKHALDPQAVAEAANACERRALDAHRLYVCAKADHDRYEAVMAGVLGAMREAATAELQGEKDQGKRNKSITNDDVEARAAHMFPDEWTDAVTRRAKAKRMLDHLERLASLWQYRSQNLATIRGKH